jgi:hypothetical protein
MFKDLKIWLKAQKILKNNLEERIQDTGTGEYFLNKTPKE